ncbi:hypothetical protein AVL62_05910 [Serinicoccus chungangensis]|uniref:Uncharacterized protein n=1 Tax=Serinicoccus chungangensis TaxID=767452 RepID=A0A0W8IGX1_9MICO|nr:hypothetical protein [Serinicoccus chungangensis]KUG59220.1 hypothetical protein AVL62_05910 [Serinicoccus chungangensis]
MARTALRFGLMRAAAVVLALVVLIVALLRREAAFLGLAVLVPFICVKGLLDARALLNVWWRLVVGRAF